MTTPGGQVKPVLSLHTVQFVSKDQFEGRISSPKQCSTRNRPKSPSVTNIKFKNINCNEFRAFSRLKKYFKRMTKGGNKSKSLFSLFVFRSNSEESSVYKVKVNRGFLNTLSKVLPNPMISLKVERSLKQQTPSVPLTCSYGTSQQGESATDILKANGIVLLLHRGNPSTAFVQDQLLSTMTPTPKIRIAWTIKIQCGNGPPPEMKIIQEGNQILRNMFFTGENKDFVIVVNGTETQLGNKYGVKKLEDKMIEFILEKDINWFTPDSILELYFISKNVQTLQELKEHALMEMSGLPEQTLKECGYYKMLKPGDREDLLFRLLEWNKS